MKRRIKNLALLFALFVLFANKGSAQVQTMMNYVFSADSVNGFDEQAASVAALADNCFGKEYKVFMYRAKRDFIKQKYNLKSEPAIPVTLYQNQVVQNRVAMVGACNNEDFELAGAQIVAPGPVQGWLAQSGTNNNSCNPPQITGNANYTVFVAPTVDTRIGQVSSYFDAGTNATPAGNCFIRMNDDQAGAKASKLTKSFIVTPSNAFFQYAYLPVIEDGGHLCCEQAGFNIHVTITNTTTATSSVLACPQISIAVPSALCQFTPPAGSPTFVPAPGGAGWSYHPWAASVIDLTPYIGDQVTLEVVVVDCNQGGHGGYAYFDAKCAPMTIMGNNNPFPAGTPSITLPTCGLTSASVCAPPGVGPYTWTGPGLNAPYNTPLNSNQCFTTNISADFTLTMSPPGGCNPIERVVTVTITPAPYILATAIQAVCGSTTASVTWTAAGSASVNPTITFSPTPVSTSTSAVNLGTAVFPAGTGVVTITAADPLNCLVSTTVNINPVPPVPTVTLVNVTGSPSVTCLTPTIVLTANSTYTFGSLNYNWTSNSFTNTTQSISVTAASTLITLTVTDPVTNCMATATTSIFFDKTIPTSSVNPVSQTIGCGVGVVATCTGVAISPTTNVTHTWISATPGTPPISSGGQTSIFSPPPGPAPTGSISTFVLTNNINGCSVSKTVAVISTGGTYPTFSLASTQQFSIGCGSTATTDIKILGAQTTPSAGVVSYTVLFPGFSGSYTTSPVSVYSVNAPGTYTAIVRDDANGCETHVPISIIQNTFAPNISYSVPTVTLTCNTPSVVLTGTSTNVSVNYNWGFNNGSGPGNVPSFSVAVNTTSAALTNSVANNYTLTVQDNINKCFSNTVVTIYQNMRPPLGAIASSQPSLTCSNASVNLSNNSTHNMLPGFPIQFGFQALQWDGPPPQQQLLNSTSYMAFTPGTYTMTVKDLNNGCIAVATTTVYDARIYPVINTPSVVPLDCGAANTGGAKVTATVVGLSASQVNAQWTTPQPPPNIKGANTLTLTTDGTGEYKLTVTTLTNQCTSRAFVTVVNGELTAAIAADQTTGFAPMTVNFTNSSSSSLNSNSITSVWSFGNGTTRTTTTNLSTSALYNAPGTYTVTMFASKGTCRDTVRTVIFVDVPSKLEVPNVFTPNGDNSNDLFFLKTANLTNITAQIFDRWGNKIYELTSETGNIAWDGKNQAGKEVPDGTYFYTIKATGKDGQSYDTKGTVSLYR